MIRLGDDHLGVEAKGHLRIGMSRLRHDEGTSASATSKREMKVRRSEYGVTSGIGSRPAARRSALASFAAESKETVADAGGVVSLTHAGRKPKSPGSVYGLRLR